VFASHKLYLFTSYSNEVNVSLLGKSLRDVIDLYDKRDSAFSERQLTLIGHSRGGLDIRSYMQEYQTLTGPFAGLPGGSRVSKLITLATPHDGSFMANGAARNKKFGGALAGTLASFDFLFYTTGGPRQNEPNRSDLHWDNLSPFLDYDQYPDERNSWLVNLNASTVYDSKIIAYAGVLSDCSGVSAYCYGNLAIASGTGLASDGVVPYTSAEFYGSANKPRVLTRYYTGYNHSDMVSGKPDGALFANIRNDLVGSPVASNQPFGSFDTPLDRGTYSGEVALTGWALDDQAVTSVELYRTPALSEPGYGGTQLVFLGNATFVNNARPDIAQSYPGVPNNTRAGWGYMLLSNLLPNFGNESFLIAVFAKDADGHRTLLGTKVLTFNNNSSAKPFGTIDTPAQGETISGTYTNFGWALTPLPNSILTTGATIDVYVDDKLAGHPVYNLYRSDIAALFPGLANSAGAIGYFQLNTRTLANGPHTIYWAVRDSGGNVSGIGSRYFTVQN